MGLFDKKFCDICGEKIGMLGNRKLEDGNMCKDCAKKLSPFCDDRRHSTLEQIKEHLQYREENKAVLRSFSPSLTLGQDKKIYIDNMNRTFVVSRNSPGNWAEENPDVIPIAQITSCGLDIDEDRDEIYTQNGEGQRVSYNPPRYKFYYNFKLKFLLNNPYFDDFEVKLNNMRIEGMGSMEYNRYQQMAMEIMNALGVGNNINMAGGMNMYASQGMPQQNMYAQGMPQQNMYAQGMPQQNMYAQGMPQQNMYAQGMPQQNMYAQGMPQQNMYAQGMPQQNMGYQQNVYGQPQQNMAYQQNPYGQAAPQNTAAFAQSASGWICECCGTANESNFCSGCGAPRG